MLQVIRNVFPELYLCTGSESRRGSLEQGWVLGFFQETTDSSPPNRTRSRWSGTGCAAASSPPGTAEQMAVAVVDVLEKIRSR